MSVTAFQQMIETAFSPEEGFEVSHRTGSQIVEVRGPVIDGCRYMVRAKIEEVILETHPVHEAREYLHRRGYAVEAHENPPMVLVSGGHLTDEDRKAVEDIFGKFVEAGPPKWGVWCEIIGGYTGETKRWLAENGGPWTGTEAEAREKALKGLTRVGSITLTYTPKIFEETA